MELAADTTAVRATKAQVKAVDRRSDDDDAAEALAGLRVDEAPQGDRTQRRPRL